MNSERIADVAAAGSFIGWLSSVAVQTLPIIQWLAGLAAIVAGLAAAYYHIQKARQQ
jgi:hypothetical protein